ncbi:hypothetical protein EHS25_000251 [Saitozyma podzolica]|uniref:Uncharacterized protein n=1 Tax=Saitozyma podzolica TaxID=1890683 RepID=A0A427YVY3_9TREE|nr:hypothetical protein EHS25_000251 [Saitozyma podzolica]
MPSLADTSLSILPDLRPKSPRRFFTFSHSSPSSSLPTSQLYDGPVIDIPAVPPLPPLPSIPSLPSLSMAHLTSAPSPRGTGKAVHPARPSSAVRSSTARPNAKAERTELASSPAPTHSHTHSRGLSASSTAEFGMTFTPATCPTLEMRSNSGPNLGSSPRPHKVERRLGTGATVVRTPSDAIRAMTQSPLVQPSHRSSTLFHTHNPSYGSHASKTSPSHGRSLSSSTFSGPVSSSYTSLSMSRSSSAREGTAGYSHSHSHSYKISPSPLRAANPLKSTPTPLAASVSRQHQSRQYPQSHRSHQSHQSQTLDRDQTAKRGDRDRHRDCGALDEVSSPPKLRSSTTSIHGWTPTPRTSTSASFLEVEPTPMTTATEFPRSTSISVSTSTTPPTSTSTSTSVSTASDSPKTPTSPPARPPRPPRTVSLRPAPAPQKALPALPTLPSSAQPGGTLSMRLTSGVTRSGVPPASATRGSDTSVSNPLQPSPFSATVLSSTSTSSPASSDATGLVTLHFSYSSATEPDTSTVTLPLDLIAQDANGRVIAQEHNDYAEDEGTEEEQADGARILDDKRRLSGPSEYSREGEAEELYEEEHDGHDEPRPEMTDGSSAEESDVDSEYGLTTLLRDDYLRSLWLPSPAVPDFSTDTPVPPVPPKREWTDYPSPPRHRARTRNQYVQLGMGMAMAMGLGLPLGPGPDRKILEESQWGRDIVLHEGMGSTKALNVRSARRPSPQPQPTALSPHHQNNNSINHLVQVAASAHCIAGSAGLTQMNMNILLLRDSRGYHLLARRLLEGSWPVLGSEELRILEKEMAWLGAREGLIDEVRAGRQRGSPGGSGGEAYTGIQAGGQVDARGKEHRQSGETPESSSPRRPDRRLRTSGVRSGGKGYI